MKKSIFLGRFFRRNSCFLQTTVRRLGMVKFRSRGSSMLLTVAETVHAISRFLENHSILGKSFFGPVQAACLLWSARNATMRSKL